MFNSNRNTIASFPLYGRLLVKNCEFYFLYFTCQNFGTRFGSYTLEW